MSWKFAPIFSENAHLHLCFLSYGICAVANISSVMILGGKEGEQEYNGARNSECSQLESEVIFCMTMDFVFNSNLIQWTDLRLRGRLGRFYQKADISLRVSSLLHFFCYWWRLCWQNYEVDRCLSWRVHLHIHVSHRRQKNEKSVIEIVTRMRGRFRSIIWKE